MMLPPQCIYIKLFLYVFSLGLNVTKIKSAWCKITWNFDVGLPSVVVASSVKLHVSTEGIGVYREAVRDNFPSRGYSKAWLCLMVFPEKGKGYP